MNVRIAIFNGIDISVLKADSKIWFRMTEVAKILELTNTKESVTTHCRQDQYRGWKVGKGRPALYVTESGLYRLILRSKAPVAIKFQDWVCDEVLPQIRKHGVYLTPQMKESIEYLYTLNHNKLRKVRKYFNNGEVLIEMGGEELRRLIDSAEFTRLEQKNFIGVHVWSNLNHTLGHQVDIINDIVAQMNMKFILDPTKNNDEFYQHFILTDVTTSTEAIGDALENVFSEV